MKKIIGILGVAVIAATMFFSTNNVNSSSSDASLASLMNMNVAHAQVEIDMGILYNDPIDCTIRNSKGELVGGTEIECSRGDEDCTPIACVEDVIIRH